MKLSTPKKLMEKFPFYDGANHFNRHKARLYIEINPKDLSKLSLKCHKNCYKCTPEYIKKLRGYLKDNPALFYDVYFLMLDVNQFRIYGHEGRHRMKALIEEGIKSVPLVVILKVNGSESWIYNYDHLWKPETFNKLKQVVFNRLVNNKISQEISDE